MSKILTLDKARKIRILYATGRYTQQQLATKMGVCRPAISNVLTGKVFKERIPPAGKAKDVKMGQSHYRVYPSGRIWSFRTGKWLKESDHGNGYITVSLEGNGRFLHRIILETFVGKPKKGQECRHIDGKRSNNSLSNLKWGTRKENAADKIRHGTNTLGDTNGNSVLRNFQVKALRFTYRHLSAQFTQWEYCLCVSPSLSVNASTLYSALFQRKL